MLDIDRPFSPCILYSCTYFTKLDTDSEIQHPSTIHASGKPYFEAYRRIADYFHKVPRHFEWQPSARVSQTLPQLYNFSCRQILALSSLCRNTLIYAHMTSRTSPTFANSLGPLTLPMSEAGHFVKLILIWFDNRAKTCCPLQVRLQKMSG